MGLIKAAISGASSTLADQWKEYFYCDSIEKEVLVKKGQKRVGKGSSNTHGSENIISNGSGIAVADGQCMIIVEQGKIVEFCAEPGVFTYDSGSEPSIFYGGFGKGIIESFKTFGKRFTYGGMAGNDQRVYYFNTKEIIDNKFGTQTPVPFRIVDRNIGLDIDVSVRCSGIYSYKITDPIKFYANVCGNITGDYLREEIEGQLKTEFVGALQPSFARISAMMVRPNELPAHASELAELMNEELTKKWGELRGLSVISVALNPISLTEEDQAIIKDLQKKAVMRDPAMGAAALTSAQAEAMVAAANNDNGAVMGLMGMGMANVAGGVNATNLYNMAAENQKNMAAAAPASESWTCSCGAVSNGKFCPECGAKKPEPAWKCSCGTVNQGKFCSECGAKRPE